jgi:hypothetical protein
MEMVSPASHAADAPPAQFGVIVAEAKLQQLQSESSFPGVQSTFPSQSLSYPSAHAVSVPRFVSHSQLPEFVLWHFSRVPPPQLLAADWQLLDWEHVSWLAVHKEHETQELPEQVLEQEYWVEEPVFG